MSSLLVIGATGSVGRVIGLNAMTYGYGVFTAGPGDPMHDIDIANGAQVVELFRKHGPWDHVVVASGINVPTPLLAIGLQRKMVDHFTVNCAGPLVALQAWLKQTRQENHDEDSGKHFCVISSNSATIPRTQSLAYCASKAALSMGIRVAAREAAGRFPNCTIWGMEPGWISGTEMSKSVLRRLPEGTPPHRIPGGRTNTPESVADFILSGIRHDVRQFNGCLFAVDGGEL